MATQQELILEKLNKGNWVCSTELIDLYSVDYRSQINKLRKKGYDIIAKPCDGCGRKHSSRMNTWYLQLYNVNGVKIENNTKPKERIERTNTSDIRVTG